MSVAVDVFKADDAMGFVLELFFNFIIRAGRIGDIKPPSLIKIGRDWATNQGRSGDHLDLKAIGHGESLGGKFELGGWRDNGARGGNHEQTEAKMTLHNGTFQFPA